MKKKETTEGKGGEKDRKKREERGKERGRFVCIFLCVYIVRQTEDRVFRC